MISMTLCGKERIFRGGSLSLQMLYHLPSRMAHNDLLWDPESRKYCLWTQAVTCENSKLVTVLLRILPTADPGAKILMQVSYWGGYSRKQKSRSGEKWDKEERKAKKEHEWAGCHRRKPVFNINGAILGNRRRMMLITDSLKDRKHWAFVCSFSFIFFLPEGCSRGHWLHAIVGHDGLTPCSICHPLIASDKAKWKEPQHMLLMGPLQVERTAHHSCLEISWATECGPVHHRATFIVIRYTIFTS